MKTKMNWKIGNSTLRNPERILKAFPIFVQMFANKIFDATVFIWALNQSDSFSYKSKNAKVHANFIRSVFRELGLITTKGKQEVITDVGNQFLNANEGTQRIFLQQLSKFQFKNGDKVVKPFLIFVKMMNLLLTKGIFSITKDEFQLFVMTCMDINDCENQIEKLIEFRQEMNSISYSQRKSKKKEFVNNMIVDIYFEDYTKRVSALIEIFTDNSIEYIQQNHQLLDSIVSSSRGSKTKNAIECKNQMIDIFIQTKDLQQVLSVLMTYYTDLKRKSLVSDANMTLNYFSQTGLLSISKNEVAVDSRYTSVFEFVLNSYPSVVEDKDTYIENYCFATEMQLVKKLERVEFNNSIMEFLFGLKQQSTVAFMTMLMYLGLSNLTETE